MSDPLADFAGSGAEPAVDVSFAVPFMHRLRFTRDVLGADSQTLVDLLESAPGQPARVQFWIDSQVADAQPDLSQRIYALSKKFRDSMSLAGNVQLVPGGEEVKNDIHLLERMLKVFHAHDLDRRSYVVVIGGGAVLDAVGFAMAIAHRGLRLVRVPTTTLAQADSGIGVKNAVNAFQKKNWIGTFGVPWGVINDAALLATLPDREFVCGFVEAVKVSLLKEPAFFADLCAAATKIRRREMEVCLPAIRRSALWHLRHITRGGDPFEMREARPLDFGHWSAHKLEVLTNFAMRHGEAVAIGVAIDTIYSSLALGLPETDAAQVLGCLRDLGFTLDCPQMRDAALFNGLEEFRQHLGGRLTLTMLRAIGKPVDVHEVDLDLMHRAIEQVAAFQRAATGSASFS
ncbi:MAG TPA: 3-dehydroquinate synthase [Pirellulales bacterium]|jgi:3-dehydroquinate synthase